MKRSRKKKIKPVKRRGNRRYYQRNDVLIIRSIRYLLYEHGFTIGGARVKLEENASASETPAGMQEQVSELIKDLEDVLTILKAD